MGQCVCLCVCVCMCTIYWCSEIRSTDDSPLFRYETFINFLTLVFRHEERGTHNFYYTDYYLTQQTSCASRSPQLDWTGPVQSWISTNVFFKITKFSAHRFRALHHLHPSSIFYLGFLLWHLWLSYLLRACVNCTQCVCSCTWSRIVQSQTKPNDKILLTKNDWYKKIIP